MPCERIGTGFVCGVIVYRYKNFFFEFHNFCGYSPLRKDGGISKRIPSGFWDAIDEFHVLSDEEKEKYRV